MATSTQIQNTLAANGVPAAQIQALTAKVQQTAPGNKYAENMRRFSDLTSKSEGTGDYADPYAVGFGGVQITDFTKHPNKGAAFKQTDGKANISTAAGKHQFLGSTYLEMAAKTGRYDFTPEAQEINFEQLMKDKKVDKLIANGDFTGAIKKLGGTFASFPSSNYKQPKHTWEKIAKMADELGAPQVVQPTYAGEVATKPKRELRLTQDDILTAALPTVADNLAEAAKRDSAFQAQQQAIFSQEVTSAQAELAEATKARSAEIDAMLSTAFGYDEVFAPKPTKVSAYDRQLDKLIDLV